MRRVVICLTTLALLWLPLVIGASPDPELEATDRAHEALAQGRPAAAVSLLQRGLSRARDPEARDRLRCLLGAALLESGSPRRALEALQVRDVAPCSARAAFLRAEALLALDRADEAVEIYDSIGGPRLGPDRDAQSADALARIARRRLEDPDHRGRGRALEILAQTLELKISDDRRRALVRELIDVLEPPEVDQHWSVSRRACAAILEGLHRTDDRLDRLRAARVCGRSRARMLLEPLSSTPDVLLTLAQTARGASADRLRTVALESLGGEEAAQVRRDLARARAERGQLTALPLLEADPDADALRIRADLLARIGREEEAVALLGEHRRAHPADPFRAEVARQRGALILTLARRGMERSDPEAALGWYDALLEEHPDHRDAAIAAWEAGVAERARGDAGAARRRWRELLARFPSGEGARQAIASLAQDLTMDQGDPEGAFALLRQLSQRHAAAAEEAATLQGTDVWIEAPDRVHRAPTVRIGTRNLESVELRLHRIDAEAYVRSGGRPGALRELDVGVVEPDRIWTVPVPGYTPHASLAFDLPVDVPGPGLYAVTVASAEEEARTLVLVSDLTISAQTIGGDLAVATFVDARDGASPVGRARVLVISGEVVIEGRTDASGLWTASGVPDGEVVILALHGDAPAFLELSSAAASSQPPQGLVLAAELDRPIALPGDTVGLRVAARRGGTPVQGEWTLWLEHQGIPLAPLQATSDRRGLLTAEVPIPPMGLDKLGYEIQPRFTLSLMGIPPDDAVPVQLTQVQVAPELPGGRSIQVEIEGDGALVQVREARGEPASAVIVAWTDPTGLEHLDPTDDAGQIWLEGPPRGIPWTARASIAGTSTSAGASRLEARRPSLALGIVQDRLRPGEVPEVKLYGEEPATVHLVRLLERPEPPAPVPDPWIEHPRDRGPSGWEIWHGAPTSSIVGEEHVSSVQVQATEQGARIDLEPLAVGRWALVAVPDDGRSASARLELQVHPSRIRLVGDLGAGRPLGLGRALELGVDGGSALITVTSDRLLWAGVRSPRGHSTVEVQPDWGRAITISALDQTSQPHQRVIEVDPTLQLELQTVPRPDGRIEVTATVTDGVGRPVRAQVSLAAWDLRLESQLAPPPRIHPLDLIPKGGPGTLVSGVSGAWSDGDPGASVAAALQDEAKRKLERGKARRASSGLLSDNSFARAKLDDLPIPGSTELLGTIGTGGGGGGLGYHSSGGLGTVGEGEGGIGISQRLIGARARSLWAIVETDRQGSASAILDGPPATWRIRATALTDGAAGIDDVIASSDERLWLSTYSPAPGGPDDRATPRFTLVNGTDASISADVHAGATTLKVSLAPGEGISRSLGEPRAPGPEPLQLRAETPTGVVATAAWRFPLAAGWPDPGGSIETHHGVPQGAFPFESLALADDPRLAGEPWRHAARGRAALVALEHTDSPRLRRAVRDARDMLRLERHRPGPAEAASALLFFAELRDSGLIPVVPAELELEATQLLQFSSVEASAWTALARAQASLPVDPDLLQFLRSAELDDEGAGLLARALLALGQRDDARAQLASRRGLHRDLVARALGEPLARRDWIAEPPQIGSALWSDWIRLVGTDRRGPTSTRVQRILGGETPTASQGGLVVLRSAPPPTGQGPMFAQRIPRGPDGLPLVEQASLSHHQEVMSRCNPCRILLGEALELRSDLPLGWQPTTLSLVPSPRGRLLLATTPGTLTLGGLSGAEGARTALVIEVIDPSPGSGEAPALSGLEPGVAMALDRVRVAAGLPPLLTPERSSGEMTGPVTQLALTYALRSGDIEAAISHVQRLIAVQPQVALELETVAQIARGMATLGRAADAARMWRAGLDAAFTAEAGRLDDARPHIGTLATARLIRSAALRYPDGPAVGDALYLLPSQLRAMASDGLDAQIVEAGITAMDLRLTAAAWDRELLALDHDHPKASAAGLRLARSLVALGAPDRAADWAESVARAHPDDPLLDALIYLQALALTEAGASGAEALLDRLVREPFPDPRGVPGPSVHRDDARLVLGRMHEARGHTKAALETYAEIASTIPEARRSTAALQQQHLEAPHLLRLEQGEPAQLEITIQGIDTIQLRTYRIDLRTVFLRDAGLSHVQEIWVGGVAPEWAATRRLGAGPFPEARTLRLPLRGNGAWLVQIEGGGQWASALIVRSSLQLSTSDAGQVRRLTVRRGQHPAGRLEVRALTPSGVQATTTDVRGVAEVPAGSQILVFDGADVAFTTPEPEPYVPTTPAPPPAYPPVLFQRLDQRLGDERARDQEAYRRRFASPAAEVMSLEAL